jgi:hypothetical protein
MSRAPFPASAGLPASRARLTRRTVRGIPRVLGELAIVFVGVYAAFALSEYQQERERNERREQLRHALLEEIADITYNARGMAFFTAGLIAQMDSLQAAGETPPLRPFLNPLRVEMHMWEAALASGALDLLDVPTMQRMSRLYNSLTAGFEQFTQLRHLSESLIVPRAGDGPTAFYDPETRSLRPEFAWYREGVSRLQGIAAGVTEQGESLVRDLERGTPSRERAILAVKEEDAQRAAEAFLQLLDDQQIRESWAAAAPELQRQVPVERWEQLMRARGGWRAVSREIRHRRFLPDRVAGAEYVAIQFEVQPPAGRRRLETLSMVRAPDGVWQVGNYMVQ